MLEKRYELPPDADEVIERIFEAKEATWGSNYHDYVLDSLLDKILEAYLKTRSK
jgi:hypothetical protein